VRPLRVFVASECIGHSTWSITLSTLTYTRSCHLEGLKLVHAGNLLALCLHVRTPGCFHDIDLLGHGTKDAVPSWKAFVGDPHHLLFEHNLEDCSIICTGEHSFQRDYTRKTPPWTERWRLRRGLLVEDLD